MSNEYYSASGWPGTKSSGVSSSARAEMALLQAAFDKLPTLAGNGGKIVQINVGATGLTSVAVSGTGSVAMTTSPTFVTPTLGAALATSINGIGLTGTGGKTFTLGASVGLTGTDGSTLNIGTGGTLGTAAYTAATAYAPQGQALFVGTTSIANNRTSGSQTLTGVSIDGNAATVTTNANLTGPITSSGNVTAVAAQTGTGSTFVMATSPTLITPNLGVATATSLNGIVVTGTAGKTINVQNSIGLLGIDSSNLDIGAGGYLSRSVFDFRLTLTSVTPVTTADTTAGTIICTPYNGNLMGLYNGTGWLVRSSAEISIAVPAVANKMYDVFVFDNAGTATLEVLAWTDDTNRATALARQDGVLVKNGAATRRYIGSFRTNGANQAVDSFNARWLWNMYNRVVKPMRKMAGVGSAWTYGTATVRQANADSTNQLDFVIGVQEDEVSAEVQVNTATSTSSWHSVGIGLDSTSSYAASSMVSSQVSANNVPLRSSFKSTVTPGRHFLSWNEYSATGNASFFGDTAGLGLSGIIGELRA